MKLKYFLLLLSLSLKSFSMTEKQYNNSILHEVSALNLFIEPKFNEQEREKALLMFIDFFLKAEELEIKKQNIEKYNSKLSDKYIENYFAIKNIFYKRLFQDKDKFVYNCNKKPIEYLYLILNDSFNNKSTFEQVLNRSSDLDYKKFLFSYYKKYNKINISEFYKHQNMISDENVNKKSNEYLIKEINKLIKNMIVGSNSLIYEMESIVKYDFITNKDTYQNKLVELLHDNHTLFSFKYDSLIKGDKLNLKINNNIIDKSFKDFLNDFEVKKNIYIISAEEIYIVELLKFFLKDYCNLLDEKEKKANQEIANEKKRIEEEANRHAEELIKNEKCNKKSKNKKSKKKSKNKKLPTIDTSNSKLAEKSTIKEEIKNTNETSPTIDIDDTEIKSITFGTLELKQQNLSRAKYELTKIEQQNINGQKMAEEKKKFEERKISEEKKIVAEKKKAEEARIAEEKRKAEEARIAEEKRIAAEKKKAEEARIAEEKRIAAEKKKAEERRKAEEARIAEEKKKAEERRKAEEARIAAEKKEAEEARIAAEKRKAEEARKAAEKRKAEEARKAAEKRKAKISKEEQALPNKIKQARSKKPIIHTLVVNDNGNDEILPLDNVEDLKNKCLILRGQNLANIETMINYYNRSQYSQNKDPKNIYINTLLNIKEKIEKNIINMNDIEDLLKIKYSNLLKINDEIQHYLNQYNEYVSRIEDFVCNIKYQFAAPTIMPIFRDGGFVDKSGTWYPNLSNHSNQ